MRTSDTATPQPVDLDRLARLEERVARLEAQIGLSLAAKFPVAAPPPPALAPVFGEHAATTENFEVELGQNWFALAGIAVLTAGLGFLICLPYPSAPPATAPAAGLLIAAGMVFAAHRFQGTSGRLASFLHGAATALIGVVSLRLFLFGARPAVDIQSVFGVGVVFSLLLGNAALAARHGPWLTAVAFGVACAVALGVGTAGFVLLGVIAMGLTTAALARRPGWAPLLPVALVLGPLTYFAWAMGNPFRGGPVHFVGQPSAAPPVFLIVMLVLGAVPLLRKGEHYEEIAATVAALLNCLFGYGVFLVHTAAAFGSVFAQLNVAAAVMFIALAAAYFLRQRGQLSTFLYAMTGYIALSLGIMKLSSVPTVFVWLSLQSVVVVATAIWFRSRFIIVANFFIFALIIASYLFLGERERGWSLTFGFVALITARILKWQKDRLELKTEVMRNAYLVCAFCVFPYALYHLVPKHYVGLAWVGLAAAYYLLNFVIRNQKYRWMGHATLMLATVYVVTISVSRLDPVYRVLSFFALGALLLIVSVSFTRARKRAAGRAGGNGVPP